MEKAAELGRIKGRERRRPSELRPMHDDMRRALIAELLAGIPEKAIAAKLNLQNGDEAASVEYVRLLIMTMREVAETFAELRQE